ncbi:MAG: 16S rRNA (adenine(1518)-N(6)/adenine(1519)-N(6))-dimethyltransferase RsmA [bacterium]|nr:16S rRNA (adenine(1518)-N(6)/adenine(1519)-N(6))-dimethyltransferase RsmA [bacterium]
MEEIVYSIMSRYLGQHFLKNTSAINNIIDSLDLKTGDFIIEIGPGKGALTIPLAKRCQELDCHIVAIEKDYALAKELARKMTVGNGQLEIVNADALKKIPDLISQLTNEQISYKIIGNIPYYITGKLLRMISELPQKPKKSVLTIQKEVAERINAKTGRMNLLAAAVQIWADSEIIKYLKATDFEPAPKVESAIIRLTTKKKMPVENEKLPNYYKFIKIIFKQPRKTLANNLSDGLEIKKTEITKKIINLGLRINSRPQDLTIKNIIDLINLIQYPK